MTTKITTLFVPSNPTHLQNQLPIADELRRRGHCSVFLVRDAVVAPPFRVGQRINRDVYAVAEYKDCYQTDTGHICPALRSYRRSKREISKFLHAIDFQVAVMCNDASALFDRIVVDFCRRNKKRSLLVQESIKQDLKPQSILKEFRSRGLLRTVRLAAFSSAGRWATGPFFRRSYMNPRTSAVAAAGSRFRDALVAGGYPRDRIRITGVPRLDGAQSSRQARASDSANPKTLLYCHQPLPNCDSASTELFRDLFRHFSQASGRQLIIKLHPRDASPDEWWDRIGASSRPGNIVITRDRDLTSCFVEADAFLTLSSTTAVEALAAGLPIALIDYFPTRKYLPYGELGAALSVDKRDSLGPTIDLLLDDQQIRDSLLANAQRVVDLEIFAHDGRSASRIADYIEEELS